ncbi:MAG TPA: hypothetical protein VN026_12805 [Bacteroidia bacterium]|jgi:hypothetical protein|nr:hypothetical protein [Bacteroidia bacterium]
MEDLFVIAEKLENKLLTLQTPEFIDNFILNSFDYLNNEKRIDEVKNIFQDINDLYTEWDNSLRKLLGLNVPPSEKKIAFSQIEERIKRFEFKNSTKALTDVLNNTPYSLLKSKMYEPQCKQYISTIKAVISEYKNIFVTNYEFLTPAEIVRRKKRNGKGEEPGLLTFIKSEHIKHFETICEALAKLKGDTDLVEYCEDGTYIWNTKTRGNILKLVAFSVALEEGRIIKKIGGMAQKGRAYSKYFNIKQDIIKQFEEKQIPKSSKFKGPFEKIISDVLSGKKVNKFS